MGSKECLPSGVGRMIDQVEIYPGILILAYNYFHAGIKRFAVEPGLKHDAPVFPVRDDFFLCFADNSHDIGMLSDVFRRNDDIFTVRNR